VCDHPSPHHLIEKFDTGKAEKYWMCCHCGAITGRYKYANINHCTFNKDTLTWIRPDGTVVSEYQ
jgi:hypothetical protein